MAPNSENHPARASTRTLAGPHVEVRRENARTNDREVHRRHQNDRELQMKQKRHQRGGNTPIDVDVQEEIGSGGGEVGGVDGCSWGSSVSGGVGGIGDSLEPRSNGRDDAMGLPRAAVAPHYQDEGRESTHRQEGEAHAPQAAIAAIGKTDKDNRRLDYPKDMSQYKIPADKDAHDAIDRRGGTHGAIGKVTIAPNKTGRPGKVDASIERASFSVREVEDKKGSDSPREGWRKTERDVVHDHDHDHDHDRSLSVRAQPGSKKTEAGLEGEADASGSHVPRLVTVSVKPRGMRQQPSPDSAGLISPRVLGGEDSYAASPGGGQASQGCAASGIHPLGQGGGRDAGEGNESHVTHGRHSSTTAGGFRDTRPGEAGREGRQGPSTAESSFSPSRLGIEGEGHPDVLSFDLDDISEIDAGGEWAAGRGEGSLSS